VVEWLWGEDQVQPPHDSTLAFGTSFWTKMHQDAAEVYPVLCFLFEQTVNLSEMLHLSASDTKIVMLDL